MHSGKFPVGLARTGPLTLRARDATLPRPGNLGENLRETMLAHTRRSSTLAVYTRVV
jgi:hypothetical protein